MDHTVGIILAGGQARRMGGGDKGRLLVGGSSILARTIACLRPQVGALALSANGKCLADLGLPLLPDHISQAGPLAGVLAGLHWAADHDAAWLLTVPGDCPFLPHDLAARLHAGRGAAAIACASSGGRTHPIIALWPVTIRTLLQDLIQAGTRKVGALTTHAAIVEWPILPRDPFYNVNTPENLQAANQVAPPPPADPRS